MKKILSFLLSLISIGAFSQSTPNESLEPKATEVWDLKPNKITPGAKPGEAPSDAERDGVFLHVFSPACLGYGDDIVPGEQPRKSRL